MAVGSMAGAGIAGNEVEESRSRAVESQKSTEAWLFDLRRQLLDSSTLDSRLLDPLTSRPLSRLLTPRLLDSSTLDSSTCALTAPNVAPGLTPARLPR
jgi:hypothetical protein